jgi:hypothetical protein
MLACKIICVLFEDEKRCDDVVTFKTIGTSKDESSSPACAS